MADDADKTEWATPRKREEARKQGNYAHSHDLTQAVLLLSGLMALSCVGGMLAQAQITFFRNWLGHINLRPDQNLSQVLIEDWPRAILPVLLPVMACVLVTVTASVAIEILQGGFFINPEGLAPKWERLNFLNGFKRIFSFNSAFGAVTGMAKIAVIAWSAWRVLGMLTEEAPNWWHLPVGALMPLCGDWAIRLGYNAILPMVFLAAVDYGFKRWRHEKELMMSREEIREETRQQEGDPHVKGRIRQVQRQVAMRRMMQKVPQASVIITNPTHVAVALQYEPGVHAAPIVVAKGEHKIAERIKAIAAEHGIPIVEEPPLARAMLKSLAIGEQISLEFYRAVAEILVLLQRARQKTRQVTINSRRSA